VHEDAVEAVTRYFSSLQNLDLSGCIDKIDLMFLLGEHLESCYKEKANGHVATKTLVTKIMMGTLHTSLRQFFS